MESDNIVRLLGGEKNLGATVKRSADFIKLLRDGLQYQSLDSIIAETGLAKEQVLSVVAISKRTIARRLKEDRLTSIESDRLYRLARIAALAQEVFGDKEKARTWLLRSNRALNDTPPLDLLDTDEGARQVEAVLGRIAYGVFS